jgi:hypothetical protein
VLTANTKPPEVTETTVSADLLEPFKVVTQLRVHTVRQNLQVLAVDNITLTVQEPYWNLELGRVLNDCHQSFQLVRVEIASSGTQYKDEFRQEYTVIYNMDTPLVKVYICLLANNV